MATKKKLVPKSKPALKTPPPEPLPFPLAEADAGRAFDIEQLRALTASASGLADAYDTVLAGLTPSDTCPQRVMRVAHEAGELLAAAKRIPDAFTEFALNHRLGDGGFEHLSEEDASLLVISFPQTGGTITPKWKDEAVRLAEELATLKGEPFDEEVFEREIRARTKPSKTNTKVQLTEAS